MVNITDRPENADDILFPTEGGLFFIPLGETIEYGANADLPASAVFAGILEEAGITESVSQSVTTHKGYAGGRAYRSTVDSGDLTIQATLMEYEPGANKYINDAINAVTGGRHFNAKSLGKAFQLLIVGEDVETGEQIRQWHPRVQVTTRGDRTFNSTTGSGFDLTFTSYATVVEGETTNYVEWKDSDIVAS
jgi:hypothetical protein